MTEYIQNCRIYRTIISQYKSSRDVHLCKYIPLNILSFFSDMLFHCMYMDNNIFIPNQFQNIKIIFLPCYLNILCRVHCICQKLTKLNITFKVYMHKNKISKMQIKITTGQIFLSSIHVSIQSLIGAEFSSISCKEVPSTTPSMLKIRKCDDDVQISKYYEIFSLCTRFLD